MHLWGLFFTIISIIDHSGLFCKPSIMGQLPVPKEIYKEINFSQVCKY